MKIAINTNLEGLSDVAQKLSEIGTLIYPVNYDRQDCLNISKSSDVIFTNPNNLGFRYDREFISKCSNLRYLITASTGTDHIDVSCLKDFGVRLIFFAPRARVHEKSYCYCRACDVSNSCFCSQFDTRNRKCKIRKLVMGRLCWNPNFKQNNRSNWIRSLG